MDEIELKFLDIDVKEIKKKLLNLGAKLIFDSQTESYPFLKDGFSSYDSNMNYLRIRKIDDDVKITYKAPAKKSEMTNREEIEITVDSYENGIKLLENLGFVLGDVFKKHRISRNIKFLSRYEIKIS